MIINYEVCSVPLSKKTYSLLQSHGSKVLSELKFEVIHLHFDKSNNLISIVTTNNLHFPFQNDVNFHVEIFNNAKYLGIKTILKTLKLLENALKGKGRLISRHSVNEIKTLLMLNDLDYFPIKYSFEGERTIYLQKRNQKNESSLGLLNHSKKTLVDFLNNWISPDKKFSYENIISSEYEEQFKKNNIFVTKLSKNCLSILDKTKHECVIDINQHLKRKDLIIFSNFLKKYKIKSIYINFFDLKISEILFLNDYNDNRFEASGYYRWTKEKI